MRWRPVLFVAAMAVLSLFLQGGCIFSPRAPDGPPDQEQTDWETPTSTSIVLQNLVAALEGENSANYRDSFTENYEFHVDPGDSNDAFPEGEERYADWTREDEEHAIVGIFNDASSISLTSATFEIVDEEDDGDGLAIRKEDYTLVVTWSSGAHINEEITYKGRATLYIRSDDTERWAIFQWVDRRTADPEVFETWGVLRGDYRG